eukprot:756697-Hanusia_phi.AAC.7
MSPARTSRLLGRQQGVQQPLALHVRGAASLVATCDSCWPRVKEAHLDHELASLACGIVLEIEAVKERQAKLRPLPQVCVEEEEGAASDEVVRVSGCGGEELEVDRTGKRKVASEVNQTVEDRVRGRADSICLVTCWSQACSHKHSARTSLTASRNFRFDHPYLQCAARILIR